MKCAAQTKATVY